MKILHLPVVLFTITVIMLSQISCTPGGPPVPGREMSFAEEGVSISVADGWQLEVEGTDWTMWQRVQKGRGEVTWVFPPVTATNVAAGTIGDAERYMTWKFKGVEGVFDETISPMTSNYPVPPGLWSLDPVKLDLIETQNRTLAWPGLSGIQPTVRLYENTHGAGASQAIWHTYVVTFAHGPNTYEFVMSLPDEAPMREWIDEFWASIEDVTIELPG